MDAIHVNHDPTGWGPSSLTFSQLPGIEATDDLDRLYSYVDYGTKSTRRDEDFDDFALVDNKLQSKTKILSRHGMFQPKIVTTQKVRQVVSNRPVAVQRPLVKRIYREQTLAIRSNWNLVAELSKQLNEKMNYDPGQAEEIHQCGSILTYKKSQDTAITTAKPKLLNTKQVDSRGFITTTASSDPVMEGLKEKASIFITDTVLVTIMAMNRSVYPWDLQVTKANGKIFFDKLDESSVDQLSMNENNPEHMPDEDEPENSPNNPKRLSDEALRINKSFLLSSITEPRMEFGPVLNEDVPIGFKYRKWKINEETVIVRTEIDTYTEENNAIVPMKLFAVNEYDTKITGGYKEKLETKKGQIFANEIKNNSCKISKWALKAMLAGVEIVKIAYVCREHPNATDKHHLVYVQKIRVQTLMQDLNLSYSNCWGVFKSVVDAIRKEPDGKYVLIKDPMKPVVRIFSATNEVKDEFGN